MRANYTRTDGTHGVMELAVIVPQSMNHQDGFTLLGFNSWEDYNDEKLASAATQIVDFNLERTGMGFKHD